jgi:RHS repeat-associated protein
LFRGFFAIPGVIPDVCLVNSKINLLSNPVFTNTSSTGAKNISYRFINPYDRGFTGHEMLPQFNLVNMNARLYDPLLGRVLSPDNFVQLPDNTQSYNRYTYCNNNPLKYTDPSGNLFGIDDAVFIVAAVVGGTFNLLSNLGNIHGNFLQELGQGASYFGAGAIGGFVAVIPGLGAAAPAVGFAVGGGD